MTQKVIIGLLAVLLLGALFFIKSNDDENELYRSTTERLHKQEVLRLEQLLLETSTERDSLVLSLDSVSIRYKNDTRLDSIKIAELGKIPGTFRSRSSKELQEEMIRVSKQQ